VTKGPDGNQVLTTRILSQHPVAAAYPYLRGDQVPPPPLWVLLAHTLRSSDYIREGQGHFLHQVASSRADARALDSRPVHPDYLPPFIFTDNDAAITDGLSLLLNMCK
jgi:hypothetical protein